MISRKKKITKFQSDMYVRVYELAKAGMATHKIAKALGIASTTLDKWLRIKPSLRKALEKGRSYKKDHAGALKLFHEFVYQRLPKELQELWEDLQMVCSSRNSHALIEGLLGGHGTRVRQHLFLYALTVNGFDVSKALHTLNISRRLFEGWCVADPDFALLWREIVEYKKDFYENALLSLVARGDSQAIIFVNRTYNRDRGYGDKTQVEVSGSIDHDHQHKVISLDQMDLPLETRKQILQAMRQTPALEGTVLHEEVEVSHALPTTVSKKQGAAE